MQNWKNARRGMMDVDVVKIKLVSMIVHLAEYIETGERVDIDEAKNIALSPEIAKLLIPGPLIPLTRSGKSVSEILGELG